MKSDDESDNDFKQLDEEEEPEPLTKIFFCSRTHSQLSQFIGELKNTKYAETTRLVTLGNFDIKFDVKDNYKKLQKSFFKICKSDLNLSLPLFFTKRF